MEIKIYADVLFFTNLLMDYALLYISLKIIKRNTNILRLILAAVIGAVYSVFAFFVPVLSALQSSLKIIIASLMVFIAFIPNTFRMFLKHVLIFLAVSFSAGGIAFCILYCTQLGSWLGTVLSGGIFYVNVPIYKLLFVCVICYFTMTVFASVSKKYRRNAENTYDVSVFSGNGKASFKALLDSGNFLTEPKSGIPVMIVRKGVCDFLAESKNPTSIGYKSLSGYGELYGFMPDKTIVNNKKINIFIAISETKFGDGFDAILPCNFDERIE